MDWKKEYMALISELEELEMIYKEQRDPDAVFRVAFIRCELASCGENLRRAVKAAAKTIEKGRKLNAAK